MPNLKAQVHPSRTILVSPIGAKDLTIYAEGKLIKGPVTAVQIAIWNEGSKPIKSDDILERIQIKTASGAPIIAAHISKITREVNKVTLDTAAASSGVINLKFKILEKGDAFLLQLTYEGDEKVEFIGSGVIIGQSKFVITEYKRNASEPNERLIPRVPSKIIGILGFLVIFYIGFSSAQLVYKDITKAYVQLKDGLINKGFIVMTIINLFFIVIAIVAVFLFYPTLKDIMAENSPFLI